MKSVDVERTVARIDAAIRDHMVADVLADPEFVRWEDEQVAAKTYRAVDADGLQRTIYEPGSGGWIGAGHVRPMLEFLPAIPPLDWGSMMTITTVDYMRGLDVSGPVPLYAEGAHLWLECVVPDCPADEHDEDDWLVLPGYGYPVCSFHAPDIPTHVRDPDQDRRDREAVHEPLIDLTEIPHPGDATGRTAP